jgi:FKBP-type peptidyl-prolyl cis-trans isomerase
MSLFSRSALAAAMVVLAVGCSKQPADAAEAAKADAKPGEAATAPALDKKKVSTMIAIDIAHTLEPIKDEIDVATLARVMQAQFDGKPTGMTDKEAEEIKAAFSAHMQEKMAREAAEQGAKNEAAGAAFLAANKGKPGVHETPSGLQYQILRAGAGARPTDTDTVRVIYKGTTLDGKEFDSTAQHGTPDDQFMLNQVIPGWTEGLKLMTVGSRYKLWIPAKLAYGQAAPPQIGPNQTLVFEVELLDIVKQ